MGVKTTVQNRLIAHPHKILLTPSRAARPCRFKARRSRFPAILEKQALVFAALILMSTFSYYLINRYALSTVIVQGRSMAPTLEDGDHFLLNRLSYLCREPKRGDLVVLRDPGHGDLAVKRIVGLPGEQIEVKQGLVFVNGRRLREIYLPAETKTLLADGSATPLRLGTDQYFVLGDNRDQSEDSRYYGPVLKESIVGTLLK